MKNKHKKEILFLLENFNVKIRNQFFDNNITPKSVENILHDLLEIVVYRLDTSEAVPIKDE